MTQQCISVRYEHWSVSLVAMVMHLPADKAVYCCGLMLPGITCELLAWLMPCAVQQELGH